MIGQKFPDKRFYQEIVPYYDKTFNLRPNVKLSLTIKFRVIGITVSTYKNNIGSELIWIC